jgi:hypothetical protein
VVDGALRLEAESALRRIAESISGPLAAWVPAGTPEEARAAADVFLGSGAAGFAVLQAYLAVAFPAGDHAERSARYLETATDAASLLPMDASLFSGFTGVAWAVEHLADGACGPATGDRLDAIDDALLAHVGDGDGPSHFDLVSGLVGIGVYAAERLPRPGALDLLRLVVARLWERGERFPEGIAWRTPDDVLASSPWPLGPFDLGLAHGIPCAIALLAIACAHGVEPDKARALLEGAVAWLRARSLRSEEGSAFPRSSGPGSESLPSRLAWCYGDAGIASALFLAGRGAGVESWVEDALGLARRAAARDPATSGVRDAPLCHGAAGVAHIFNRFHQSTGEQTFADAARAWIRRTLDYLEPGRGIGGFRAWLPDAASGGVWVDDPGLLSGSVGVGLALLAAVTPIEPEWDRVLLLSARSSAE